MNEETIAFGALPSKYDPRTIKHKVTMTGLLVSGGHKYTKSDIEHQHGVGICTAAHIVQERQKVNGRKYSLDFHYLLQKKFYDKNWYEGSSIFSGLKVGKNYGFLPRELFTWVTESDRFLPYADYIAKLKAIPDEEITRLIGLCVDKIPGYAQVNVTDPQAIAKAIVDSQAGILCRYDVGIEWYTPSWKTKDINPMRAPKIATSGHAIDMSEFDYSDGTMQVLPNTWGTGWNRDGQGDINWDNYKPTEAWIVLKEAPVIPFWFTKNLYFGLTDPEVMELQKFLNKSVYTEVASSGPGSPGQETKYFGSLTMNAVARFQRNNGIFPAVGYFGPKTRAFINSLSNSYPHE